MRISDWSSDVCSSDLSGRWHGHRRTGDLKGIETITHDHRESWLNRVAAGMAPLFEALEARLPDRVRVAIGFTSAGAKGKAIGEHGDNRLSADGPFEIFLRQDLAHAPAAMPAQIGAILAPELAHAAFRLSSDEPPPGKQGSRT